MPSRLVETLLLLICAVLAAACSSTQQTRSAYQDERFATRSPFQRHFAMGPIAACHLGQRALLSQAYQIENGSAENIRGTKYFRSLNDQQMRLEITLVCLPDEAGTVMYASAVQTRFELKASASNTGLSVAGIGSISLPWAADKEALIKVGEETVTDPDFYNRFFELLKHLIE